MGKKYKTNRKMVDGNPTTPITILNLSSRKNITEARDCQNGL